MQKRFSFANTPNVLKEEWGSALVQSYGGAVYFVKFIDHSNRKVWASFLQH